MGKLKVHKGLESQSGKKDQEMWFIVLFSSLGGKESTCNVGDTSSIPGLGRSPGEGIGYPLQYSCLENSMDRGAWRTIVHGVTKSWTQL